MSFKYIKILSLVCLWLMLSNSVLAHDITPNSLIFDKSVNDDFENPPTLTFEVTDNTGCNADITATSNDTEVVRVSPSAQEGVSVEFEVIRAGKFGPASTTILVTFKGKGTNSEGVECNDDASGIVNVEVKPGILEVTPNAATHFVMSQGDLSSKKSNNTSYTASNVGDDFLAFKQSTATEWINVSQDTLLHISLPVPLTKVELVDKVVEFYNQGLYSGKADVINATNGMGSTSIPVFLLVGSKDEVIALPPDSFFACNRMGKCDPANPTVAMGNANETSQEVTVSSDQDWLDILIEEITSGNDVKNDVKPEQGFLKYQAQTANTTLEPGNIVNVATTPNSNVYNLPDGKHSATLTFTDTNTQEILATRMVSMTLAEDAFFKFPNDSKVVSPYWQTDSGTYTFMSVSHPSLSGMSSRIGVSVSAVANSGLSIDVPAEFTISSGESEKVFIVTTNNSVINPTNLPNDQLITANESGGHGQVIINPVASNPKERAGSDGAGFRDVTMLSLWGAVVILNNSTGFAMEFVGDLKDSRAVDSGKFSGVN